MRRGILGTYKYDVVASTGGVPFWCINSVPQAFAGNLTNAHCSICGCFGTNVAVLDDVILAWLQHEWIHTTLR